MVLHVPGTCCSMWLGVMVETWCAQNGTRKCVHKPPTIGIFVFFLQERLKHQTACHLHMYMYSRVFALPTPARTLAPAAAPSSSSTIAYLRPFCSCSLLVLPPIRGGTRQYSISPPLPPTVHAADSAYMCYITMLLSTRLALGALMPRLPDRPWISACQLDLETQLTASRESS